MEEHHDAYETAATDEQPDRRRDHPLVRALGWFAVLLVALFPFPWF